MSNFDVDNDYHCIADDYNSIADDYHSIADNYHGLVYITQMNYSFIRACWLASSVVISQVLFTSEQPKKNKMTSSFASVSEEKIFSMNEEAVPN